MDYSRLCVLVMALILLVCLQFILAQISVEIPEAKVGERKARLFKAILCWDITSAFSQALQNPGRAFTPSWS